MARLNINHLPLPSRRYRASAAPQARFETPAKSAAEDATRVKLLRRSQMPTAELQALADDLAQRLEQEDAPETLASSRYMRSVRLRVVGAVWALVDGWRR